MSDTTEAVAGLRAFLKDFTPKEKTAFLLGFQLAAEKLYEAVDVVEAAVIPLQGKGSDAEN